MFPKFIYFLLQVTTLVSAAVLNLNNDEKYDAKIKQLNANLLILNKVVEDAEKIDYLKKSEVDLHKIIKPLPSEDVKCLISSDDVYCSKEMLSTKNIMIHALKEDCARCTVDDKLAAGKIMTTMMAHHPWAWKYFLTKYDALKKLTESGQ